MKDAIAVIQKMLDEGPTTPAMGFDEGYYAGLEAALDALRDAA